MRPTNFCFPDYIHEFISDQSEKFGVSKSKYVQTLLEAERLDPRDYLPLTTNNRDSEIDRLRKMYKESAKKKSKEELSNAFDELIIQKAEEVQKTQSSEQ